MTEPYTESFVPKTLRQKLFEKYFLFKLYFGRSQSYWGFMSGIVQTYFLISVWIGVTFGYHNQLVLLTWGVSSFLLFVLLGYIDVKHKIANEERSFGNRYNPELQDIKAMLQKVLNGRRKT